jgi:CRISPR/Cas system-associated exonuclease Cas4 (RecB family)
MLRPRRIKIKARKGRNSGDKFEAKGDHRAYKPQLACEVPPRVHLKPIIDKTLTACAREGERAFLPEARSGEPRATYCIHPSQAGGCLRKAFFSFVHAPKDPRAPDPRLQRIFDVGHEGHRRIQGYLFEAWKRKVGSVTRVWEDVQLKIPELFIIGELDAIVEVGSKHRYVVEIKTASKTSFDSLSSPKKEWDTQSRIYSQAVGIKGSVVYAECKDNQNAKEFWVPYDKKAWRNVEDSCKEMMLCAEKEKVPTSMDKSACRFCDYTRVCKNVGAINWRRVKKGIESTWG